jgi:hypothetical protein
LWSGESAPAVSFAASALAWVLRSSQGAVLRIGFQSTGGAGFREPGQAESHAPQATINQETAGCRFRRRIMDHLRDVAFPVSVPRRRRRHKHRVRLCRLPERAAPWYSSGIA